MKVLFKTTTLICLIFINTLCALGASDIVDSKSQEQKLITNDIIYKEASFKVSVIDPSVQTNTIGSFFPGQRGANQLIIYTPKYGSKTNTNEFGTEAIVVNNIVYKLSGADSLIPENGFVVSGHGSAKKWINENITVGSKVYLNQPAGTITSYITTDSFIFAATEKIKETYSIMEYYRSKDILYNDKKPTYYTEKAKDYLKQARRSPKNVQKFSSLAIESANKGIESAIPFLKHEFKGVWIRPTETTETDIIKTIEDIKDAGIDNIFLETYFHGKTIFPSRTLEKYKVTNQRPEFKGIDPLEIWLNEAHKRDMKVHVWFETFYVGNDNPKSDPTSILNVYPNWNNVTKAQYNSSTYVPSISEHNGFFIDPANPEVVSFLLTLIDEIATKYKPDGIHLDYIRYPQSIAAKYVGYENSNWGYTKYARADFKKIYATDPVEIANNTELWSLWAKYRQDKITSFVLAASKITRPKKILLSAVVFPDRQRSLETKMQDWKTWSVNNYIDAFTPLILTCDAETARSLMLDITRNTTHRTKIYPGLFVTFMNGATDDLLRQIHVTRQIKADGISMFDWAHLQSKYIKTLQVSVFNSEGKKITEEEKLEFKNTKQEEKENYKKQKRAKRKNLFSGVPTE